MKKKINKILIIVGSIVGGLIVMVAVVMIYRSKNKAKKQQQIKDEKDEIFKIFIEYLKEKDITLINNTENNQLYQKTVIISNIEIVCILNFSLGNGMYFNNKPLPCNLKIHHNNIKILIPMDTYDIKTDNLVVENKKIIFDEIPNFIISYKKDSISSN